jgi:hypothetical protein
MTPRRIIFSTVGVLWLVMISLLVQREAGLNAEGSSYRDVVRRGLLDDDVILDIYWNTKKVGESRTTHAISENGGTIHNETKLSLPGTYAADVDISSVAQINAGFELTSILANAKWGDQEISVVGRTEGGNLNVRIAGLGPNRSFSIPTPNAMAFAGGPFPMLEVEELKVGAEWEVPLFDPAGVWVTKGNAIVVGKQELFWGGDLWECYRILVRDSMGRKMLTAWSDEDGKLLKVEFSGIALIRRPDED